MPYSHRQKLFAIYQPTAAQNLIKQRTGLVSGVSFAQTLQQKCIFVHVPKTAGTSMSRAIFGGPGAGHTDVRGYQLGLSKSEWQGFYSFAFVRNPWDRCFSAYRYLKSGNLNKNNLAWSSRNLEKSKNFSDFICKFLNAETMVQNHVFRPQFRYICTVGNRISVDFVGKFERIEEDFNRVLSKLERQSIGLPKLNKSGPPFNYQEHYSPEAAEKVSELYATDIELFGYRYKV